MTEVTDKRAEPTEVDASARTSRPPATGRLRVTVVVSIAAFVAALLLFWGTFDFLRDADANRMLVVARCRSSSASAVSSRCSGA